MVKIGEIEQFELKIEKLTLLERILLFLRKFWQKPKNLYKTFLYNYQIIRQLIYKIYKS